MRAFVAALTFVALCLGSGCVTEPSEVADHFGNSQSYLRDAQIENPEPIPGRVDGLDPHAAVRHPLTARRLHHEVQLGPEAGGRPDERTVGGAVVGRFGAVVESPPEQPVHPRGIVTMDPVSSARCHPGC